MISASTAIYRQERLRRRLEAWYRRALQEQLKCSDDESKALAAQYRQELQEEIESIDCVVDRLTRRCCP